MFFLTRFLPEQHAPLAQLPASAAGLFSPKAQQVVRQIFSLSIRYFFGFLEFALHHLPPAQIHQGLRFALQILNKLLLLSTVSFGNLGERWASRSFVRFVAGMTPQRLGMSPHLPYSPPTAWFPPLDNHRQSKSSEQKVS